MKIIIDKTEKINIDGEELIENQMNSDFFENIMDEGLKNNLEIEINCDENSPLAKLFYDIKEMLKEDSDFRKKIKEIEEELKNIKDDELESQIDEDDFGF